MIKSERRKEHDRQLCLLSPVWGLKYVTVYGAQKSRRAVKASLYTEAVFHLYDNRERHQASLVDLNIISIHENCLSSLQTSFAASLMSEIVLTQRGEDSLAHYDLISRCFDLLNEDNYRIIVIQFVIRVLATAGLVTDFTHCPVCGRAYADDEILGFDSSLASPCCRTCDTMNSGLILPPNARRYIRDSLSCPLQQALGFILSENMQRRLLRYVIRLYDSACSVMLKSAAALLELDSLD